MSKFILLVILAAFTSPALAGDLVSKADPQLLRLHASPCTSSKVLAFIADQWHSKFKAASGVLEGTPYTGCWIDEGDTVYFYADDGSNGQLDKDAFEDEPGA